MAQAAPDASYVFAPLPRPALPVAGTADLFPIHRVYCVGRNYADHAREMGHDPDREPPFFFQKNASNAFAGPSFPYPPQTSDVHHEVELVVALGKGGRDISPQAALAHVFGYAVGVDMTRRDLQAVAKKLGRPWEVAKAFEHSAPCGPVHPAAVIGHPSKGTISLSVNGQTRQTGDLDQMIWGVADIIASLSSYFVLQPGDLIMTGTPAGVGPVVAGDQVEARVEGVGHIAFHVA